MTLELLVASVGNNVITLAGDMNIGSDAIICNQSDSYEYIQYKHNGHRVDAYTFAERGVGLNRNNALLRATADVVLFADDDIVYTDDYCEKVLAEFEKNPKADMILFNVQAEAGRETYHIQSRGRVRWFNCGRYPTYSMAVRLEALREKRITFSLLFGGGAKYCNGEDSLFIQECIHKGLKVYKVPVEIGHETGRTSTWFRGFDEKFFYDRGVLYHYMYGKLAWLMGKRFLRRNPEMTENRLSYREAWALMKKGFHLK